MNLYCAAIFAYHPDKHRSVSTSACGMHPDDDTAYSAFMKTCSQEFPLSVGYRDHAVTIQRICTEEKAFAQLSGDGKYYVAIVREVTRDQIVLPEDKKGE